MHRDLLILCYFMFLGYHSLNMFLFSLCSRSRGHHVLINVIVILDGLWDCVELPLLREGTGGRCGKDWRSVESSSTKSASETSQVRLPTGSAARGLRHCRVRIQAAIKQTLSQYFHFPPLSLYIA